ncbi:NF-kappa-B inhibitor cactus isoform X1 [Malaya genurostris]|uniref:NF-kappa-B inhibitor cactus isoform X1 n=2 Tax=Malaya genurostris TaxID=325434 RepID=UPI0026F3C1B0|nr:NF-kappa-B inhibitor cactus isoform X1 [Malaya genurostris]
MHPAKGGAVGAGGFTYLSLPEGHKQEDKHTTDSGAVDSGFHSGQNLSSDNFTSSSFEVQQEAPLEPLFVSGSHKSASTQQQEEDSQTFDSGVDLDSSQQLRSSDSMKVDNMNDLCKSLLQLQMSRKKPTWEKYFHQNDDGDTYLHLAVIHEATEVVCKLIRAAPRPWLDIQNDIGQTPLHLSVLTGQSRLVRRLILAGAKAGIRDVEGNTPLHLACLHSNNECAKELLTPLTAVELQQSSPAVQAAIKIPQDLEQWNYNGKRCVHIAAETSNIEILRYLLNAGADINSREGKSGLTPLHIAIESGNESLLNFLLDECPKLRLEQVTYAGLTAYQLAGLQHNQSLLNGLRSRGAEPLTPPESDYDDDESEEDDQIPTYYGSNAFCSSFAGLSTINVA